MKDKNIWDDRRIVAVVSLLVAVLIWMVVTVYIDPESSRTISGVSVDFSYDSAKYTALGLDIVNQPEATVNVRLEGNGTTISNIRAADILVYPDYGSVRAAGETSLNLLVRLSGTSTYSGVTATIEGSRRTVNVVFDTVVEKTVPITVQSDNISLAEGYVLNATTVTPSEVTFRGPESEIDQIDQAVAAISSDQPLSESMTVNAEIKLYKEDGTEVQLQYAAMDAESADVSLTVYQLKELPLEINFINVPTGYDVSNLQYQLSQETLQVAGPSRILENLDAISVASFDLSTFALDRDYQLSVQLPRGLVSQEGLSTITITFDTEGLESRTINVPNIRVINALNNSDITIDYDRINNVTLIGPAEELEALAASQVEAQVNAEDITITSGQMNVPVTIVVPSSSTIFAVGNYTVQCTVSTK